MTPSRQNLLSLFFVGIFIIMSFDLVMDKKTYMGPPSLVEAQSQIGWLKMMAGKDFTQSMAQEYELLSFMSSPERYHTHRVFLIFLLAAYIISGIGIWFISLEFLQFGILALAIKIAHSIFFLWKGYEGRKLTADFLGIEQIPLFTPQPYEINSLLSILFCFICIGYAFYCIQIAPPINKLCRV